MVSPKMRKAASSRPTKTIIGWREYVAFHELGIDRIKAKIDTGARSSALHAWKITPTEVDGVACVAFEVHPLQRNNKVSLPCLAPIVARRQVTSSSGHSEDRYVIETKLGIGGKAYRVELSLTNRDTMGFRLLLGRTAVRRHFLVDPGRSFLVSK